MVAVAGVPTAWALGRNSVGSKELKPNSVGQSELKDASVHSAEVDDGSLLPEDQACVGNDPDDEMVRAGPVCIDKFEASLWTQPVGGTQLTTEGAVDAVCANNGQNCEGAIFARSVEGVEPAHDVTWWQALAALANSGKRLPSNGEWSLAAMGTPGNPEATGTEDCNTNSAGLSDTGSRANCESQFGVFDMVGNLNEWVADWDEQGDDCAGLGAGTGFEGDRTCFGDATPTNVAAPLVRGGDSSDNTSAGVGSTATLVPPFESSSPSTLVGFRGVR